MLKYNKFIKESLSKTAYIHIFYKPEHSNNSIFRVYKTSDENYDFSNIKELDKINKITQIFHYKDDFLLYTDEDSSIHFSGIDNINIDNMLCLNLKDAAFKYLEGLSYMTHPHVKVLKDGEYHEFTRDYELKNVDNYLLYTDEEHIEVIITDKATEIYNIIHNNKDKYDNLEDIEYVFKGKAADTNVGSSSNTISRFKLYNYYNFRESNININDNFNKWFKNSKIVNDNNEPLIVYHGTKGDFGTFKVKDHKKELEGYYFSSYADSFTGFNTDAGEFYKRSKEDIEHNRYNPNIMPVYLSVQNPYVIKEGEIDIIEDIGYWQFVYDNIKGKGYDGVMTDDMEQIFVFSPNQIKSAYGNNGNYSLNNDINENVSNKIFDKIYLHSFFEPNNDYLSTNPNVDTEDDYIETISSSINKVSLQDYIYIGVEYADDDVFMNAKTDYKLVIKSFIEAYDYNLENTKELEHASLSIEEYVFKIFKIKVSKVSNGFDANNNEGIELILEKKYNSKYLKSYNDKFILDSLNINNISIETIMNIKWQDPNFVDKNNLLKSIKTIKKYNI